MSTNLALIAALVAFTPAVSAQSCIPLAGSSQCPGFNSSSVSTDTTLQGLYPFLQFVSSTQDFDTRISQYIGSIYVQQKFQQLLGCSQVNLTNAPGYYARYTTSVICNAIVQNSIQPCSLSGAAAKPLCADSCATFAISEEEITANQQLCDTTNNDYVSQIRADFTNCALPANALSGSCIPAVQNEPDNCGFGPNLGGLCGYCAASSPNSTDSCCSASNVGKRCTGVTLPPSVTSMPPLFTSTSTSSPTGSPTASGNSAGAATNTNHGLSGGAIAGIVIGSIAGLVLLVVAILLCCICLRRRRGSQQGSVFNQPSPKRNMTGPAASAFGTQRGFQSVPGGRVTRMAALEGEDSDPYASGDKSHGLSRDGSDSDAYESYDPRPGAFTTSAAAAAAAAAGIGEGASREPIAGKRAGSLSSFDMLAEDSSSSPGPNAGLSSPENGNATSGQSEQLPFFKDYYSSDDIHPGDRVSVLWGYQPRAGDEFELERGDMLKVIGIWDDGWATGVRMPDRAEEWTSGKDRVQRDSGVSNGSGIRSPSPVPDGGDIKAFPLVCVCLPQHWRKTIEGSDSSPSDS